MNKEIVQKQRNKLVSEMRSVKRDCRTKEFEKRRKNESTEMTG